MEWETLPSDIQAATAALDHPRAAELCEALVARLRAQVDPVPDPAVRGVLDALRGKRYFDLLEGVAAALMETGRGDARVRRLYAQALIDQAPRLEAAREFLEELVRATGATPADAGEHAEARGLLGRTFKQLYVNRGGTPHMLRAALEEYHAVYREQPEAHAWQGINAVALLDRARRDRVPVGSEYPAAECLAAELLARMKRLGAGMSAWDMATGLEACVALRRLDEASLWAHGYAAHPGADAFELGSTLRQLTEVWGLDTTSELGAAVLPLIRNGLLRRENGFFEIMPDEVVRASSVLEKVLGFDYFMTITWYRDGLSRARAVARIGRDTDRGHGTGFLVQGGDLHPRWAGTWVLVTNAHVVSPVPLEGVDALEPGDAVVTFEALEGAETYRVREVLWSSPPGEYDCSVLTLDREVASPEPLVPYRLAPRLPALDSKQRVYIIGHPAGGSLSFSIHDNLLLDYDDRRVHYRTPTEGGSSGSPVFNAQWKLVGLHHAGFAEVERLHGKGGTYPANEGIPIQAIRTALAAQLA